MIGIGHGSAYLRQAAEDLHSQGIPAVVIDPDHHNTRARRAYEKAGFCADTVCETDLGPAVHMMFKFTAH